MPRPGVRDRDARGPGGLDCPGRHERVRRPAPAPRDRPGPRQAARDLHLRRQLLGPRLPDRRPASGGPAPRAR
jgi:hypothetical protein